MATDDDPLTKSLKELDDSIKAFEHSRGHPPPTEPVDTPAAGSAQRPGSRRRLPLVILGVGVCAIALYLARGVSPDPAGSEATLARTEATPVPVSETPGNPVPSVSAPVTDAPESVPTVDNGAPVEPERRDGGTSAPANPEPSVEETARPVSPSQEPPGVGPDEVSAEPSGGALVDTGAVTRPPRPGRYAIQVGAFDRENQATTLAGQLAAKSYPSYVVESRDLGARIVFRVRLGGYPDRQAAEATGQRVTAEEGLEWYVLQAPQP